MATSRSQSVKITPTSGLTQDQIERIITEGEKFRDTDALRRELAELRNQAETLLYTTEQALDGYADLVAPDILQGARDEAAKLRQMLDGGGNLAELRDAYQRLETAAFRIAESMYGTQ